jgi:hypothetical protein
MVYLIGKRGEALVRKAKEELDAREGQDEDEGEEIRRERRRDLDALRQRLRVAARETVKGEEYEVKPGTFISPPAPAQEPSVGLDGDVQMGGTDFPALQIRTSTVIRKELTKGLCDLVTRGTAELEAYDFHARNNESMRQYLAAAERYKTRNNSLSSNSAVPSPLVTSAMGFGAGSPAGVASPISMASPGGMRAPGVRPSGILKRKEREGQPLASVSMQSPVDGRDGRRMSTGMPVVREPVKEKKESMADLARQSARRGSKGD